MDVLIIEDEMRLAQSLQEILKNQNARVDIVFDGEDGFDYGVTGNYDVIIVDVMIPKLNGYEVVKKLREHNVSTPILFLSAKDATQDKIYGLNQGADDYLTKPFVANELIARIRALTRRKGEVTLEEIKFKDLTLNTNNHDLSLGDKSLTLSLKEFQLMELFISSPKQVFSKDHLISKVWGFDSEAQDNNVEAYISFLRKKLDYLNSSATIITIRKVGYYFGEPE